MAVEIVPDLFQQLCFYCLSLQSWQQNDVFVPRHQTCSGLVSTTRTQEHNRIRAAVETRNSQTGMHSDRSAQNFFLIVLKLCADTTDHSVA